LEGFGKVMTEFKDWRENTRDAVVTETVTLTESHGLPTRGCESAG